MRAALAACTIVALALVAGSAAPQNGRKSAVAGKPLSVWANALGGKDETARLEAARALVTAGPDAKGALPELTLALRDGNPHIRRLAAEAVAGIGADAGEAAPAITDVLVPLLLADDDSVVRTAAALALGRLRPVQPSAVPALSDALNDPSPSVRAATISSLREIAPQYPLYQRLRLAAGTYRISLQPTDLRVSCIDIGRPAPRSGVDPLTASSNAVRVTRLEGGRVVDTKPLADVVGRWIWVTRTKNVWTFAVTVEAIDKGADYLVTVEAGQPGIIGGTAQDVDIAVEWMSSPPRRLAALKRLDTFEQGLKAAFGENSGVVAFFHKNKRFAEWKCQERSLNDITAPGTAVEDYLRWFTETVAGQDSRESLEFLTVLHGQFLTRAEIAAAGALLKTKVADQYTDGFRAAFGDFATRRDELRAAPTESQDVGIVRSG